MKNWPRFLPLVFGFVPCPLRSTKDPRPKAGGENEIHCRSFCRVLFCDLFNLAIKKISPDGVAVEIC